MTQYRVLRFIALSAQIALLAVVVLGCSDEESEGFRLEQGVSIFKYGPEEPQSKTWVWTKTVSKTEILDEPDGVIKQFGYAITAPSGVSFFEVYSVHHLPAVPKEIGSSWGATPEDAVKGGLKTRPKRFYKAGRELFGLDEGDPLGEYLIDVYADGELVGTLVFEVTP